jgi:hypothetical protein
MLRIRRLMQNLLSAVPGMFVVLWIFLQAVTFLPIVWMVPLAVQSILMA